MARTLWMLAFWGLLILGSVLVVQFASSRRQEAIEISYTQFTEQLDADNVAAVEITQRVQLKGDLKRPVTVGRRMAEHFTTLLPFEARAEWVQTLRDKGVDVRAREPKQSFGVFVFSFLPYLFILGLIIFMLRRMRAGNRAGLVLAECQHARSNDRTARSCPTCRGSGYVRVIPGPDGQPRRCQHAGSDNNRPEDCPTCYGCGWAGLVTGTS